ncbi:hypothetical protein QWZ13_18645 [Reinekea marina]|uniref:Uncharacterized protein n=1 Tax=Reinekea marina TaxID=1310421 RepID=A0ABV7WRS6_9GAMM|nr:hypothetical protein [Reinekea marina]MDN3650932.1 hypothetical protein [Reinekea marina]
MKKNLLVTAIAIASIGSASASSFLAGDPVESVADKDTAYDNPAFILNTKNQVTFSDWGNVGYVFNAFNQKLAVHGGRGGNAIDVFWGGNLGFGGLGIASGYEIDNESELLVTSFTGQTNFTYLEEDGKTDLVVGNDTASLEVKANERAIKSSEAQIAAGFVLNDLPIDGTISLSLPSASTVDSLSVVDVLTTDGNTTATYRETRTTVSTTSSERTGGLVASAAGRYKFNSTTYVTGGIAINNNETTGFTRSVVTQFDENLAAPATDTNETTTTDSGSILDAKETIFSVGLDHRKNVGPAAIKIQPNLDYTTSSSSTSVTVSDNKFVDALDSANNTTGPTGVTSITASESTDIDANVRVSAEFAASQKWTWRAGANIDVLTYSSTKSTFTKNKVNNAGTGYEEDYVQVTEDDSSLEILDSGYAIDLGFSFKPSESAVLDINLESNNNALQNWTANFGFTFFY